MPLEHDPSQSSFRHGEARLTPEQRDRVLDLAARLQAQHDGTVAVGDLAQAAAEAGIDPRFVHEAARSVVYSQPPPATRPIPSADRTVAAAMLGVVTLMNLLLAMTPLSEIADSPAGIGCLILAALAGHFAVRGRLPVWLVSAVTMTVLLMTATFEAATHQRHDMGHVAIVMLMEAGVAFLVGLATAAAAHFRQIRETSQVR